MLAREKWQIETVNVLDEVFAERVRQVAQYGHNDDTYDGFGPDSAWLEPYTYSGAEAIEESLRRDYEQYEEEAGAPTFLHLIREEFAELAKEDDPAKQETEALQLAALCVSFVEKLRRRGPNPVPEDLL